MKKCLFILALLFVSGSAWSQEIPKSEQLTIHATVNGYLSGKKLKDITMQVYEQDKKTEYISDSLGKFPDVVLQLGHSYRIVFSGENYVKRTINIDRTHMPEEDRSKNGITIDLSMALLKQADMVNCSKKEIDEIEQMVSSTLSYDRTSFQLEWDITAATEMRDLLEECTGKKQR